VSYRCTAVLVTAVSLLDGCAPYREVESPMRVELDVFSGRPNPSWELSAEEAGELARRLEDLRPVDRAPAEPGLGYRGFVVSMPGREIRVYQGVLTITEDGSTRRYADVNRIEGWLAGQARRHGHGGLVAAIAGEGGPSG